MVECRCGRMGRLKLLDAHGNELGAAKATDLVEGARVKYTYTCVHAPGNLGNLVCGGFGRRGLGFNGRCLETAWTFSERVWARVLYITGVMVECG